MASSSEDSLYHSATFIQDTFNESRSATLPSLRQLAPIVGYPPTYGAPCRQVAAAPLPHAYEGPDTVAYIGDFLIRESSICTNALSGSTFTQSTVIDYNGKKAIIFVFTDLSVKMEGTFVLRHRTFNLFSQRPGPTPHPILAECLGGPFEIYSTKAFPGLRPSTELTRHISLYGVRVNMREHERKRPKKAGETVGCISRTNTARAGSGPTSSGPRWACAPTVASHSPEGPPPLPGGSGSSPVSASMRAACMNQEFAHWTAHVSSHGWGLGRSQRLGAGALENNDGQDVDVSRAHVQLYGGH